VAHAAVSEQPFTLEHSSGRSLAFDSQAELAFILDEKLTGFHRWGSVRITDATFSADALSPDLARFSVPRDHLDGGVLRKPASGNTGALLGIPALILGGLFVAAGVSSADKGFQTGALMAGVGLGLGGLWGLLFLGINGIEPNDPLPAPSVKP
jgi:hypothetical protein